MDLSCNRLAMKNSIEHPRRKSREAVMMALYALEIHNNVNEKSINEIMVDEGHGKWYDGGKKDTNW